MPKRPPELDLTEAQLELLALIAIGLTAREASDHLGKSYYTVRNQIAHTKKALGATSIANAVWICRHRIEHEMGDLIRAVQGQ